MTLAKLQCSKEMEETMIETFIGTWMLAGSSVVPNSVLRPVVFLGSVFEGTAQGLLFYPLQF